MLFNTIDFAVFLPLVFVLYWFVFNKSLKWQNLLIVVASYVFYVWWDWRFLGLILLSTLLDFIAGIQIERSVSEKRKKIFLGFSIVFNLGVLGFFKYFNFFLDSLLDAYTFFGSSLNIQGLEIILPVGISFYTFQTLSYSIDIYRGNLKPTKSFISFAAFVSFFPQLVAGPIERATNLLPQFYKSRTFDYSTATDGMRQILWGMFKKIVIADNCANLVNTIFIDYANQSSFVLITGGVLFAFQIYCDFSGYSDIAIGVSKLFGFRLMQNFAFPYFSRNIGEFWRRWHISLSTWFRDYLYIPLGGSHGGTWGKIRNTFIIFIVSGFWHGANWTFIFWGALNAALFIPLLLTKKNRLHLDPVAEKRIFPNYTEFIQIISTFILVTIAWIFFRSPSLTTAFEYFYYIATNPLIDWNHIPEKRLMFQTLFLIIMMLSIEWTSRSYTYGLEKTRGLKKSFQWTIYIVLVFMIFWFQGDKQEFIYFQF
jgi:D-alanyl-lipoteichoic acid acyltransferase DltB (MBOAT superfamily)